MFGLWSYGVRLNMTEVCYGGLIEKYKQIKDGIKVLTGKIEKAAIFSAGFDNITYDAMYYCEKVAVLVLKRSALTELLKLVEKTTSKLQYACKTVVRQYFFEGRQVKDIIIKSDLSERSVYRYLQRSIELFDKAVKRNLLLKKRIDEILTSENRFSWVLKERTEECLPVFPVSQTDAPKAYPDGGAAALV